MKNLTLEDIAAMLETAYLQGYVDGQERHAWMKRGINYVGTSGTKLNTAIKSSKAGWNYGMDFLAAATCWTKEKM